MLGLWGIAVVRRCRRCQSDIRPLSQSPLDQQFKVNIACLISAEAVSKGVIEVFDVERFAAA